MPADSTRQLARYNDFVTVDWIQDARRERARANAAAAAVADLSNPLANPALGTIRNDTLHSHSGDTSSNGQSQMWQRPRSWWSRRLRLAIDSAQHWLVLLLVGIAIGANTAFIAIATEWLTDMKIGYCSEGWWLNEKFCCWEEWDEHGSCPRWHEWSLLMVGSHNISAINWLVYCFWATVFAAICAFLVKEYAPYAAGSGMPEIKTVLSGFAIKGFMGLWTLAIKSLGLVLAVSSGLSIGKEGPAVHVACCVGNVISRMFSSFRHSRANQREILSAAGAAGVAVAFGAPIGGVLFSLEDLSTHFPLDTVFSAFLCALASTVTLQAFNPYRTGKLVMFQVEYDRNWHFFELFFFIIIGIFGGLYGAAVIKFNTRVAAFRKKHLASYAIQEVTILALLTAAVAFFNVFLRIDMGELLSILLRECKDGDYYGLCKRTAFGSVTSSLFVAALIRFVMTIISYGCKVPCGIFVPSMAVGATAGRLLGLLVQELHLAHPTWSLFAGCPSEGICITPATYAFLGTAAALGGVTKMTISLVVIMYELTGALNYIVPTMITVLVTRIVRDYMVGGNGGGVPEALIRLYGLPYLDKEEHLFGTPVARAMIRDLAVFTASGMRLQDVERILDETDHRGFPVVVSDVDRRILGMISRMDVVVAIEMVRKKESVTSMALCGFDPDAPPFVTIRSSQADISSSSTTSSSSNTNVESGEEVNAIDFGPWVDKTPLIVDPRTPLETVMLLFKKLGPRCILVESRGALVGLVTRKDLLHEHYVQHEQQLVFDGTNDGEIECRWGFL
ncbi:hypothetical protein GQ42DRAFT_179345 [Ramicandelaber brevisporus]|nr:hypothetical protein GQ42DRAFT_179345 [Ramicandelaber brevisporus]